MKILAIGDFQGTFPKVLKRKLSKEKFDFVVGVGDYAGISEWRRWVMHDLARSKKGLPRISAKEFFGKERYNRLVKKDFESGKEIFRTMDGFGKPGVFVFGNGDDDWYAYPFNGKREKPLKSRLNVIKSMKNLKDLTYDHKRIGGIEFIGFGGYMDIDAYFDKKNWGEAKDERAFRTRVKRRERSRKKFFSVLRETDGERIFVFHYPPKGVFDIIRDKKDNPMNGKSTGIGFFAEAIKRYKPLLVLCGHMHEYRGMKKLYGVPVVNPGDGEKGKAAIIEINDEKKVKVKFIN